MYNQSFDFSDYEKTGNNAIDLVAQCIGHYRHFNKPIKTVVLKPNVFSLFVAGTHVLAQHAGVEIEQDIEEPGALEFDGVENRRGSHLMVGTELYVELYDSAPLN